MAVAVQDFTRSNFREFAFTRDVIRRNYVDHVFSNSPALAIFANQTLGDFGGIRMKGMGHQTQEGGFAVIQPVILGAHAGAGRQTGPFDVHNVSPDDNARYSEANWRFYQHGLAVSDHDLAINRGDAAIASFLETQTRQVMRALADLVASDLYSTTAPATALTSMPSLINTNDTVQGLSGATFVQFNSRGVSPVGTAPASISFASGSFATQGIEDMRTAYNNASEGMIQPTVILTSYDNHERYEGRLQPAERFAGAVAVADGSFRGLAFRDTPVLADRKCASGDMFFLRASAEDGISFTALRGFDFDFGPFKPSSNQNVAVSPLRLTCQLVIANRQYGSNRLSGIID